MKDILTSRQRVKNAVDRKPVDRTPIDLGMHYSTGISAFAYWNLRKYLGLPCDLVEIIDPWQFLARVDMDVIERFKLDCICFHPGYPNTAIWNPRGDYKFEVPKLMMPKWDVEGYWVSEDDKGRKRMPEGGFFFDGSSVDVWDGGESFIDASAKNAEKVFKETDLYSMYIGYGGYFSDSPDFLVDMMLEPEKVAANNEKNLARDIKNAGEVIDKMGEYIQGICIASDLGTQTAAFVRPSIYEELIAPYLSKLIGFIHENSDIKIFFHSCGAMEPFIPILIQCGVDVLNPVQISCSNMEPEKLKEKYGKDITFWGGGCETQQILGRGTAADVKSNVVDLMSKLAPNSGFVFNQVHNVMGDVPPENIVAMLDTAYEESFKYGNMK